MICLGPKKILTCASIATLVTTAMALYATLVPGLAIASSGGSFGIAKFTLQTTEFTRMEESSSHPGLFEFINEPYKKPFTQAGGHPWGLTTVVEPTIEESPGPPPIEQLIIDPTRDPKDIAGSLPPGLLGDPMAVPRCPLTLVTSGGSEQCPADTQVGVYRIRRETGAQELAPIVNVTPERGQSAEFALENHKKLLTPLLTAHLVRRKEMTKDGREEEAYGFSLVAKELPEVALSRVELTFWGVPADPSHILMRGRFCLGLEKPLLPKEPPGPLACEAAFQQAGTPAVPFITMPTDCAAGPETAIVRADSWQEPGAVHEGRYEGYAEAQATLPGATGCDRLKFDPTIEVQPDKLLADEPVELNVKLKVPLDETPISNATPQLRNTIVTLPEGMSVSPGIVDGIQACNEFGPEGINIKAPPSGPDESEEIAPDGESRLAPGHCPDASIVGDAEAITPFLPVPVKGHVYLARPGCGGAGQAACTEKDALDGNLYRLYLELGGTGEFANTGIQFKVPLETEANPATGQLTTRTLNTFQGPFSELKIKLNGGPRAPIANPPVCGPAVTTSDFTPWSAPGVTPEGLAVAGTPDATSTSFFDVTGCGTPPGLLPGFASGTVTPQAGAFTSFTMNLTRQDREQYIRGIQVHTPPGLLGMLSSVSLCGAGEAETGTCPAGSKIGTTRVATGAGSHPFEIEGAVYLTGPYEGAPFGLSIVTHAVAGPFNLGLVVVRARINVNPTDSTLTISADETGPHALPQIIFGVPLRLKRVTVNIDRPGFMFNPTNCAAQKIEATISGSQNATASVSSPFAAGGCRSLAFKPKFTVSTNGHTSRAHGASLDAKVSYPAGSFGNEANIARVKVDLPRQLPSRLTTLQQACLAATFEANPAACPAASIVGVVRAHTPLLPVGLSGPVYFVSHGGEQFPSLIVVLQGDNVRVDLTGTTFISKKGITSSTFKTLPDVPVDTFELYLPQGKYSALAANGKLCNEQSKLKMPTEFVAQNGAVIKETTKIAVSDCAASKAKPVHTRRAKRATHGRLTAHRGRTTTGNGGAGK